MQKRAGPIFRLKICYSRMPDAGLRVSKRSTGNVAFVFPFLCGWLVYQDCLLCHRVYTEGTSSTLAKRQKHSRPESIEWFIDDQAFSAVVWFGSSPTTLCSSSPDSKLDRRHTGRLRKRDNLLLGRGVGEEPNHKTARNPGPSLNNSLLSALAPLSPLWEFPSAEKW